MESLFLVGIWAKEERGKEQKEAEEELKGQYDEEVKTPPSPLLCVWVEIKAICMGFTVFFHKGFFLA